VYTVVESVLTDAMINEEATLHKAAEAEESKTRSLVSINCSLLVMLLYVSVKHLQMLTMLKGLYIFNVGYSI